MSAQAIESSPVIVGRAQLSDVQALIALRSVLLSSGDSHYVSRNERDESTWRRAYADWLHQALTRDDAESMVCIARLSHGNAPVGSAIGLVNRRVPGVHCPTGRVGWIQTVVVSAENRGQGIGSMMIETLLSWFHAQEIGEVTLETTPSARSVYNGLGFEPSGEELLYHHLKTKGALCAY